MGFRRVRVPRLVLSELLPPVREKVTIIMIHQDITISIDTEFAKHLAYMLNQMSCLGCPFDTSDKCWHIKDDNYCEVLEKTIKERIAENMERHNERKL